MSCSILILNFNGRSHLELCVPSALAAARRVPGGCPVVVVDNRSRDDSVRWLGVAHPDVEVVVAQRNDYLFSLNGVVASRPEDIVVIVNNDMRFDEDFIGGMLPHFEDDRVFAVTGRIMDWEGEHNTTGQLVGEIRHFWFYKHWNGQLAASCVTLSAGCGAFRREMFDQLGGFDPLYRPAYWEDNDLCYRAWRRGWKVIYEPKSVIYHRVGATLDETEGGRPQVTRLIRRNEVLFAVRNVGGWGFVVAYLLLLPVRLIRNAMMRNHDMWRGALRALPRVPRALARRWRERGGRLRSDDEFLKEIRTAAIAGCQFGA